MLCTLLIPLMQMYILFWPTTKACFWNDGHQSQRVQCTPGCLEYSDPHAVDYGDAQLLYHEVVTHYTKGFTGKQWLDLSEQELNILILNQKWRNPVNHS